MNCGDISAGDLYQIQGVSCSLNFALSLISYRPTPQKEMVPLKRQNHIPEEAECLALKEVIAQEEAIIGPIRKLQTEHEAKRQLLAEKAILLRRTLDSTEILHDVGSQLYTHFTPLLVQLQTQLAVQENDGIIVATHLPCTPDFMHSWGVLKDGFLALDAALKRQVDRTQERITSIAQQLYSTESLRDQMSSSISSFSSMIDSAQESIKAKKLGVLHPIRKLPVEILLQIFENCVNDEIDECHRNPPRIFEVTPTMAIRLASVYSRWRDIMVGTPYLWRHFRAPRQWDGLGAICHFENYLKRRRGGDIELIIPIDGELQVDLDPGTTIQRLNVEQGTDIDGWPTLPSPVHLWLYDAEPMSGWVVPSDLISRTTHLTVWNMGISFQEDCKSLTRLELCGVQPAFEFMGILRHLPHLIDLDLIRAKLEDAPILVLESFTHFHLQYLGLSNEGMAFLECALRLGLCLPQLRHWELSNITSECMATTYPLISAQLSATVVRLDFQGEGCAVDAIRSFIDTFSRVNTIGCFGKVTEAVLGALYEVRTFRVQTPGEVTIRCTREIVHAMPKGLEVVVIRDYEGEGRKIDQQLRKMRQNPATGTQPVQVVFENCLNILPRIRWEFAVPGPLIVIESVDPDLGPGQSSCDPGDVNDWILDQLEAADGLGV